MLCALILFITVGEDFEDLSVNFALTSTNPRQCFNVTIIDDDILELLEYFRASLTEMGSLPQNASLSLTMARVDIFDNDSETEHMPVLAFEIQIPHVTENIPHTLLFFCRWYSWF